MDAISGLYPINQIGGDGFNWWIGQIESDKKGDFKQSGRYRVRIVGRHPSSCDAVASDDLGWAITMMPVTSPHTPGGSTSVSDQLGPGVWVIGFFLDPEKQQPVIMGSVGRVANSTSEEPAQDPTPGESGCKEFVTFVSDDNKIPFDQDDDSTAKPTPQEAGHAITGAQIKDDTTVISSGVNNFLRAKYAPNTESNPGGIEWCVEIADKCGKETDLKNTFTRLFSEMLHETQRNDGKLGSYLVGELSGGLYDASSIGRKYVNKAIRVIRTFVASVKGFVLEKLKAGIKDLINFLLYPSETGNSLSGITLFFNNILNAVGCQMADLGDRLAKFLEDLIFGYLFNIYKAAACQVDQFVEGVLNKIQSLMNELLETVLGPLQDILGLAASAINIIGDAINYVLDLLGIQCNGPGKSCSKTTKVCTDCGTDKREDFLDELLKNITDDLFPVTGEDWAQYTCEDAFKGTTLRPTQIVFVGGIQNPPEISKAISYFFTDIEVVEGDIAEFVVTRSGNVSISSSLSYYTRNGTATEKEDYEPVNGILGFAPGETRKSIKVRTFADSVDEDSENFFIRFEKDSPGTVQSFAKRYAAKCTITESPITTPNDPPPPFGETPTSPPPPPSSPPDVPTGLVSEEPDDVPDDVVEGDDTATPTYKVVADKSSVKEGEFVKFNITTTNVKSGSTLFYRLFGTGITPSDIVERKLSGTFVIQNNSAQVIIGIANDGTIENEETMTFGIAGTGAQDSVLIVSDTAGFSQEELDQEDNEKSTNQEPGKQPETPSAESPITTPGGGIIDIPIDRPGDPYQEPPSVIVTGEGSRATGIALLDDTGRVSEIRITDPGFGYKLNTPQTASRECIIDSFTMLSPGRRYTSTPLVYVDGDPSIAEAVVEDGKVVSVRIKNRSITFDRYPKVNILGGGGYGARFIPSFSCLDRDARVEVGSAKIGTGKYVDCP